MATSRELPTGTATVVRDAAGGHRFEITTPVAYESIAGSDGVFRRLETWAPDAIAFGTLAQRFAGTRDLTGRVAAEPGPRERLYDVNLRDGCWTPELVLDLLPLATVVKVNDEEAVVLASLLGCERTAAAIGERLAANFGVTRAVRDVRSGRRGHVVSRRNVDCRGDPGRRRRHGRGGGCVRGRAVARDPGWNAGRGVARLREQARGAGGLTSGGTADLERRRGPIGGLGGSRSASDQTATGSRYSPNTPRRTPHISPSVA